MFKEDIFAVQKLGLSQAGKKLLWHGNKSGLWHEILGFEISNKSSRIYDRTYMYRGKLANPGNSVTFWIGNCNRTSHIKQS